MTKDNILVQVEEIYKIFKGTVDTVALDKVSCDINKGELVAIYGPSGSGKTTLLKCIGNIWKPTTGRIFFKNKMVHKFNDEESSQFRIHDIGFIFQEFNLIPSLNVYENIELPLHLAKVKEKNVKKERISGLLEELGIKRYIKSSPKELSGGEQQRVAIAVALANDPSLILADEPTANLDTENRKIVLSHLKDLTKQGKSVFIATHDTEIMNYADTIFNIDKGVLEINN
ncbi:MAG: ABC transporter ATP-binding protein [Candidatus Heimdallarchaeota archaeon]|nr:ABC transporter ATP-binding protein [Candidatus Heimdallarchaeota archaeon]MDH5647279.1 ABC transporter ATP-binding protein [Candidatus Heimdallarchaeota archaeon]